MLKVLCVLLTFSSWFHVKRAKPYAKGLAQAKVSSSDDLSMDKDEYLSRILVTPDLIIDDPDSYTSQIMPKLSVVMNASSTTNEVMSSDGEVQPVDLQQRTVQQNIKMKYCNCQVNHSAIAERKLQPILFFINKNSGGRLGAELIRTLKSFEFHPIQICDLRNERPEEKLLLFKNSSESVHVLSAGGDGTVNWLLNVLYKLDMNVASFGVIPLGTGNDLYLQIVNHIKSQEEDKDVPEHLRQLPVSPKYLVLAPMQVLAGHMRNMMGEIADGNGDIDNAVISKSADSELESGSGGSSLDASNTAGSEVAVGSYPSGYLFERSHAVGDESSKRRRHLHSRWEGKESRARRGYQIPGRCYVRRVGLLSPQWESTVRRHSE